MSRVGIDFERQKLPKRSVGTPDRGLNPRGHSVICHAYIGASPDSRRLRPTALSIRQADAFEWPRALRVGFLKCV